MAQAPQPASSKRHALIIANGDYPSAGERLAGPVRDAEVLSQALKVLGFSVVVERDLDSEAIRLAVKSFSVTLDRAGSGSIGVLYYAGHGGADRRGIKNYLIPAGTPSVSAADYSRIGYGVEDLIEQLRSVESRAAIAVVIDACRLQSENSPDQMLPPLEQEQGFILAYSTQRGSTAADADGDYAEILAKYLRQPGLTLEAAFDNLRYEFATRNLKQDPTHYANVKSRICLAGCSEQLDPKVDLKAARDRFAATQTQRSPGDWGQVQALTTMIAAGDTFNGTDFRALWLSHGNFAGLRAPSADFDLANLSGAVFDRSQLELGNFQGTDLHKASFVEADLSRALFPIAYASGARFDNARMHNSIWYAADLQGASFRGALLKGSSFFAADLRMADFRGADLTDVTFAGADLRGARLEGARIENTDVGGALFDAPAVGTARGMCIDPIDSLTTLSLVREGKSGQGMSTFWEMTFWPSWHRLDNSLAACKRAPSDKKYDVRTEKSHGYGEFRLVVPSDILERAARGEVLSDRASKLIFKNMKERVLSAVSLGYKARCPLVTFNPTVCSELKRAGVSD
jgi:uncharacterized protein YjbI with pentapeptide repeats